MDKKSFKMDKILNLILSSAKFVKQSFKNFVTIFYSHVIDNYIKIGTIYIIYIKFLKKNKNFNTYRGRKKNTI